MINYSIIIPHYNIPDLLIRCLQSIPIRSDIQVIVVDDSSPDFATYQAQYPEFSRPYLELYQTPNGGSAGRARNIGLEHAQGKWILFADADDFFVEDAFVVIEKHLFDSSDVIHFMVEGCDCYSLQPADRDLDRNNSIQAFFNGDVTAREAALWHTVVWGQMLRKSFIEQHNIRFDETIVSNDVMFAAKVACRAKKIGFSKEKIYTITSRMGSLHDSKTKSISRFIVQQIVNIRFHRYIKSFGSNRTPPCALKCVQEAYRMGGISGAMAMYKAVIENHAVFYGLKEYIIRKIKH